MTTARLDKWLFCARFTRTRTTAQETVAAGKVRLNGMKVDKPGHGLKPGDVLTLGRGAQVVVVRVLAMADRRGGAAEAQGLYEILTE
jgi:ribosome-associated heat shock protein Hsp15